MQVSDLSRCWTLLEFANAAASTATSKSVNDIRVRIDGLRKAVEEMKKDLAEKRSQYNKQADELKRMQKYRQFPNHAYTACKATKATRDLIERRNAFDCKGLGEAHEQIWKESDPRLIKNAISLAEWKDRMIAFAGAGKRDASGGGLDQGLRSMMLALVLLRADSKKDACETAMAISANGLPELLPNLMQLSIARCAALLPHCCDVTNPFRDVDAASKQLYSCPASGPTKSGKDQRRLPLAIDEYWLASDLGENGNVVAAAHAVNRIKWKDVGRSKPGMGDEILNDALAGALGQKRDITREDLKSWGVVGNLSPASHIRVGDKYFTPCSIERRRVTEAAFATLRDILSVAPMCKIVHHRALSPQEQAERSDEWVFLQGEELVMAWKDIGSSQPKGNEIPVEKGTWSEALARELLQQKFIFRKAELDALQIPCDISPTSYIKVGDKCFTASVLPGFQAARSVMGSKKTVHPVEASTLQPCLMLPEGSPGVTELFMRVLVELSQAKEPQTWVFQFMYPDKSMFPEDRWRSPQELLYAWFASAAKLCTVSAGGQTPADKQRAKYLLEHMHPFLRVAGVLLIRTYPKQTAKVASMLWDAQMVAELVKGFKEPPALSDMLRVLRGDTDKWSKVEELEALQAQADAAGRVGAEAGAGLRVLEVLGVLEEEPRELRAIFDKVAESKIVLNLSSLKTAIENQSNLLHRSVDLQPLPTDKVLCMRGSICARMRERGGGGGGGGGGGSKMRER